MEQAKLASANVDKEKRTLSFSLYQNLKVTSATKLFFVIK